MPSLSKRNLCQQDRPVGLQFVCGWNICKFHRFVNLHCLLRRHILQLCRGFALRALCGNIQFLDNIFLQNLSAGFLHIQLINVLQLHSQHVCVFAFHVMCCLCHRNVSNRHRGIFLCRLLSRGFLFQFLVVSKLQRRNLRILSCDNL